MRVMVVRPGPAFSVADVHRGWVKALRGAGVEVLDLNFDDRLDFYSQAHMIRDGEPVRAVALEDAVRLAAQSILSNAYLFWPHVIIIVSAFFVPHDMYAVLRDRGHHVVLLLTESPYEDDRQLDLAPLVDTVLVNDPTNLAQYRALNPNSHYAGHCYDPDMHHPGPADPALTSDFAFVGTGFESRIQFLEQVAWPTDEVLLAGMWEQLSEASPLRGFVAHPLGECLPNDQTAAVYRSTKVSANLYRRESQRPALSAGFAVGPREIELAATGTFFLRESRAEGDELFPMLPTFHSPDEFSEQLRWWLAHDRARDDAAARARAAVEHRTFDQNVQWLLNMVGDTITV